MRKILTSLVMVLALGVMVSQATASWFVDAEAANGDYTAGTLDLTVNDQNGTVVSVVRTLMKPQLPYTFQGYNQQFVLKNAGNLPGVVSWKIKNIKNYENSCIEPETAKGDASCGTGADQGELGQYTWIQWSRNQAPWGNIGPQFNSLNTAEGVTVTGPTLQPNETLNAYMWLDFPSRADNMENVAQGDSLTFDVEFSLDQIH